MLKRQKQVTVRFTEEEYHQLKNKCDAAGMKMEPFLRALVSGCTIEDKLWACYLHACIRQVEGEQLTNSSLRERFGLKDSSAGSISRLIKEAVSMKLIKPLDSSTAPRYMKYIPIWA